MRRIHDPRWAYVLVNLATLFWAGNMTLGRALRDQIGPFTLTAARVGIVAALFLVLLRRLPKEERRPGRAWPWLLGMAFTGVAGFPVLLYLALRYTTASNAALINGTGPLITALLACWLLRTGLTRGQMIGAVLSLFGVLLVIGGAPAVILDGFKLNPGDILVVINVVMWGLYSIMSRIVTRDRSVVWATAFSTWYAVPMLLPGAFLEWQQTPPVLSWQVLLAVLYVSIFAAFLAFLAWNEGVRRVGPAGAMAFYNMLPVFGVLMGAVFLGEHLAPGQLLGGALVVVGGLLAALWQGR